MAESRLRRLLHTYTAYQSDRSGFITATALKDALTAPSLGAGVMAQEADALVAALARVDDAPASVGEGIAECANAAADRRSDHSGRRLVPLSRLFRILQAFGAGMMGGPAEAYSFLCQSAVSAASVKRSFSNQGSALLLARVRRTMRKLCSGLINLPGIPNAARSGRSDPSSLLRTFTALVHDFSGPVWPPFLAECASHPLQVKDPMWCSIPCYSNTLFLRLIPCRC